MEEEIVLVDFVGVLKVDLGGKVVDVVIEDGVYVVGIWVEYLVYLGDVFEVLLVIVVGYGGGWGVVDVVLEG